MKVVILSDGPFGGLFAADGFNGEGGCCVEVHALNVSLPIMGVQSSQQADTAMYFHSRRYDEISSFITSIPSTAFTSMTVPLTMSVVTLLRLLIPTIANITGIFTGPSAPRPNVRYKNQPCSISIVCSESLTSMSAT